MMLPARAAMGEPAIASLDATLAPGKTVRVTVAGATGATGAITIAEPAASVAVDGPLPGADGIAIRTVAISGGNVVHVRVAGARGTATEAIVALRRGTPSFAWSGRTGLGGDPGERTGTLVSFEDATGDGLPEALIAQVNEAVRLCGTERAWLFPRALDPRTGELRPVLLNRLRGLAGAEVEIAGRWESPGPTGAPIANVASFTAASTSVGDGGDAMRLSSPLALGDGDPATTWAEGRGGNGGGEFVTATLSSGVPVRAVAIIASPAGTPEAARGRGRPTSMRLVFGARRFHVTFPGDPAARPGEPIWVVLPEPLAAECLSLVLDAAIEPPARRGVTPAVELAEVRLYTELDFGGGTERLIADLGRAEAVADGAARLLSRAGDRGAQAVASTMAGLSGRARALGARVLADHHGPSSLAPLAALLGDPDERVGAEAVRGLSLAGPAAVSVLVGALPSAAGPSLQRGAAVLSRIGGLDALAALVGRAGSGEAEDRRAVREAIALAASGLGERAVPVLAAALVSDGAGDQTARRLDVARALDPAVPAFREILGRALEATPLADASFADRVLATRLMGRLCEAGDGRFAEALARALTAPSRAMREEILRAEAGVALGRCGPRGAPALADALGDPSPRVRGAAIDAVARARVRQAAARLARVARQDRWAFLRTAALEALGVVAPEARGAAIAAALQDPWMEVRRTGIRLAIHHGVRGAADALAARAADAGEEANVRTEAVAALGQLCAHRHVGVVKRLARVGHRPDATDVELAAAATAVEALGRLGGPVAEEELRAAARQSSPPALRLAAERARRVPRCGAAPRAEPGR